MCVLALSVIVVIQWYALQQSRDRIAALEKQCKRFEYVELSLRSHTKELTDMGFVGATDMENNVIEIGTGGHTAIETEPPQPLFRPRLSLQDCRIFARLPHLKKACLEGVDLPDDGLEYLTRCQSL